MKKTLMFFLLAPMALTALALAAYRLGDFELPRNEMWE
jgi:hypothetical protein